ncbi:TRAP transporter substrate-binding protein DctP [bacterium]|nr:TRAP transporter substrate-binding protein DctP [bacterium]
MKTRIKQIIGLILVISIFSWMSAPAISSTNNNIAREGQKPIVVKMATLAPSGSAWHEILKDLAAEWSEASNGRVKLRIYPGGVAGDEADMIRKMRIGQLHAAAITNAGLSRIASEVLVLTIPMANDSWEGLDQLRDRMGPRVEAMLEEKGFKVLNWGDAGWVRFFVPEASPTVEAVRQAKLFVWAGDDRTIEIWKAAGFRVVPLAATDILPGLQTGMINAFNTTPVMALASQWFPFTKYMIEMPWAPLIGATVISLKSWNKIPEHLQPQLVTIAHETGLRLQSEIRRMESEAIVQMEKRGLQIITPTPEQIAEWRKVMKGAYPKIRGPIVPVDWFDDALRAAEAHNTSDGS